MAAIAVAAMIFTACSKSDDTPAGPSTGPSTGPTPEEPSGKEMPTWIVYEANPRFFATNDCLNALSAQLQRISDLGCNVLWIMPICEPSTASQSVGSPYSIKNYDVINPKYGTLADLQSLVNKAHGLGMKVILDWVPNHTGWDNPWIYEHPEWFLHNNKGEIVSPPGMGWNDVAQLDYSKPGVAEGMSQAIEYWVTAADVDGFRFDYASSPYIPSSFWIDLAKDLRAMKSDMILLAECSDYSFYSYGYDMIYDWGSASTISNAFLTGKTNQIVQKAQAALENVPEGDTILRYVFNHDTMAEQSINTYYGSINALPAAYVCSAMLNGTPLIYSGMDAQGLTGKQSFFNYKTITFSDQLTPVYAAINNAFKKTATVRSGSLADYSDGPVMAFTRTSGNSNMLVMVNCSGSTQKFVTPITLRYTTMTDLINGGSYSIPVEAELDPYGYMILISQ
ncbi:MAG: hypothetical protein J1F16_03490 [Muribaculaceae bacterium]|nr:hypothetical protein [Muribaculaceae bacterium]